VVTLLVVGGGSLTAAGADSPVDAPKADGSTEVLLETSFEQVFPRFPPWRISHPPNAADVDWGRTRYRASDESWSIYCAGLGPAAPGDGGPAPANTASWVIAGPYDLSETTAGTLTFDLWLGTEAYQDVFMWLVSTDGSNFSGSARSTSTNGWRTITVDLASWGAAGRVIGEDEVWLAFVYQSDSNRVYEGAYLDHVLLEVNVGTSGDEDTTYTTDADFAQGESVGVDSTSDRLELTDDWDALPYLWVPSSVTGTVSKVDVETGDELARYRTGPDDTADPGVAVVDLDGACWVGNRALGSVVKIGLVDRGGCVDRDGDGEITTSRDRSGEGDITGTELLDWGDDECVVLETVLVDGSEAVYTPGEDHESYVANNLQALAVDPHGDVWAGVYDTNLVYRLDGSTGEVLEQLDVADEATYPTAAVIDDDGTLWLSSWPDPWVLGFDPASGELVRIDLSHGSSGLAFDANDGLFVTGLAQSAFSKIDRATNEVDWSQPTYFLSNGVATDEDRRIWIAAAGEDTLARYTRFGELANVISVPGAPTGVAMDQGGRLWVVGSLSDTIYRIDPTTFVSDLQKSLVGSGGHDATGDFSGVVARNLTSRYGTWTVNHDSGAAGTPWGRLSWQGSAPDGTSITVRARSSEDEASWSAWEIAANGADLTATPAGRYLQIEVALHRFNGDELPTLGELTVTPASTQTAPVASFSYSPVEPAAGASVTFTDTSSGGPTSWTWNFGDGATSNEQSPSHVFASSGDYEVSLAASNAFGSDSASATVTVRPASGCSIDCSADAPQTASLNETVAFTADGEAVSCSGDITYQWSFGDGATSGAQNPSHSYGTIGTLRWRVTASADDASCVRAGDITIGGAGPDECVFTYWVPVVSHADGANGSIWRSDVGLLGSDPNGADVELRLHTADGVVSRPVTVVSDAMVNLADVVDWLDPGATLSAALEVCSDGALVIDSRTYNVLANDHDCFPGGTFGQHLPGFGEDAGLASGGSARLGQLRESDTFRTNIGLVNTGDEAATVEIVLLDATGAELTTFQVDVDAGLWRQDNRPFANRAGRTDLDAASARVTVVSGGGVIAYGSVIDSSTNDAYTVVMSTLRP
jgi:PKD repeat protein